MNQLPTLKPGDQVEIVAPASRCSDQSLAALVALLSSWQLNCRVSETIFGSDLLCANTDATRSNALIEALHNPDNKAVICARGGYGSMRLIPALAQIPPPHSPKLFVGMSDITALHLFLRQHWGWPTVLAGLSQEKFSAESLNAVKSILFGDIAQLTFTGKALNESARKEVNIEGIVTGGNLCLVQTSIGTPWQIESNNHIVFLEEVGERGYRIDRMLEHLQQANCLSHAAAIVFGDFTEGDEKDGSSFIQPVLERFAEQCDIPVIQVHHIGHGPINFPLVLGIPTRLQLGNTVTFGNSQAATVPL